MTDDEARELGARFVACRAWRWADGMVALNEGYVVADPDGVMLVVRHNEETRRVSAADLPDVRWSQTRDRVRALLESSGLAPGWARETIERLTQDPDGAEARSLLAGLERGN
jgi:hypothetical protein